ncbi:MAG: sigma-70 family RNA polymerase sigma factor [Planctomycetota bacterium]
MPPASPPPPSFVELYADCAAAVRAWAGLKARGALGTWFDADDLAQEIAYHAWRAHGTFDPARGSFRGWLFGVANKVALGLLRSAARERANAGPFALLESRAGEVPDELTTISRRAARDEAVERFLAALDQLTPKDRDLFLYRGLEGLSLRQAAEVLGLSHEATKKRWQRLREELRAVPAARALMASDADEAPPEG